MLFGRPGVQGQGTYVVLTSVSDTNDPWYDVVDLLAAYRNAPVVTFQPALLNNLLPELMTLAPRYAAVVVRPTELDINFIRRFLMMSTQLDDDPFSDFSYGYITGATAQDAVNFVNNIIFAEQNNVQNFPLNVGGYAASSLNFVFTSADGYLQYLNPFNYSCIYMETNDDGSGEDFFLDNTSYMMDNKLLDIGHNGDPHMLWLFEGGNMNPDPPVWDFDSTLIEDPAHARVGLTSQDIGGLNLYPAVAFNGACHAGETKRVMIEGDIAATFGDTQGLVKFYTMSDTFSFALSILKTGITGYFAACGANNANDQGEEVYNAFLFHEPLGDIHKRTIDGVVMGFLGNSPNLRIFTPNSSSYTCDIYPSGTFNPNDWSGAYSMLGGKANRIYFGDPLFNPYANHHSDSLNRVHTTIDSVNATTLDLQLDFNKPDAFTAYFPVWDKFHFGDTRIYTPVELPSWCQEVTSCEVIDSSGAYHKAIHAVEHFDGKTILHIEVDIPEDMYDPIDFNITFRLTVTPNGIAGTSEGLPYVKAYPNPCSGQVTISFLNPGHLPHELQIIDVNGRVVRRFNDVRSECCHVDLEGLVPGIYRFRLIGGEGISGQGTLVVL